MKSIALFGVPGAGKGTQSQLLIEKYNFIYIATGDMLRQEIKDRTTLGKLAEEVIAKGELVSDELIIKMIAQRLDEHADGSFLFDGMPRTLAQAAALERILTDRGSHLTFFLNLELSLAESMKRLLLRAETSGRSDDNRATIELRFKEYRKKTAPVSKFYQERGVYHAIKGCAPVNEVFESLCSLIDNGE